jgi:glutamate transport system substrate-binding protein
VKRALLSLSLCATLMACTVPGDPNTEQSNPAEGDPLTGTISVKVDGDQPGWGKLTLPSTFSGFDYDFSNWLADREEFQASHSTIASKDREQVLTDSDGRMLVIATYSITDPRRQKVGMAGPYIITQQGVMVRKGNKSIRSTSDLIGKLVCTADGTTSRQQLEALGAVVTLRDGFGACNQLLIANPPQVDAVSTDVLILYGFARENLELQVVEDVAFGNTEQYGVGFKRGNLAMCKVLTEAIKQFIISGQWDTFYRNHGFPERLKDFSRPDPNLLDECDPADHG